MFFISQKVHISHKYLKLSVMSETHVIGLDNNVLWQQI